MKNVKNYAADIRDLTLIAVLAFVLVVALQALMR